MSTNGWVVDNGLLPSLKLRGYLPNASNTTGLARADLLRIATEELRTYVASLLKTCREEFLVSTLDATVGPPGNGSAVTIPPRAAGSALRLLQLVDPSSGVPIPLLRVEPEQAWRYGSNTGQPIAFRLQGNTAVMIPAPDASYTIRIRYQTRPNALVSTDDVGEITAVDTVANTVTVSSVPITFAAGVTCDFINGTPGFDTEAMDQTILSISGVSSNVLSFASLPSTVSVGDFVCLSGQSPIPQCPVECFDLLAARVAVKIAESQNDQNVANKASLLQAMRTDVMALLTPRVTGSARKIINWNGPGWSRRRW